MIRLTQRSQHRWEARWDGKPEWCVGLGSTRKEAIGDLIDSFPSVLGMPRATEDLGVQPLDGMAACNAIAECELHAEEWRLP